MKAEELRIGNYVYDLDGDILQIDKITNNYVKFKNTSLRNRLVKIQPIPLSEEILLKCGFIKIDQKHNFFILGYEVNLKIGSKINWVAWCNTVLGNANINYLHQLQNLYYALTGKELQIKL